MNVRAIALTDLAGAWRNATTIVLVIGLLGLGLLFHQEIVAAVSVWSVSTAYNHCFLVLPIVFYLIWDRRETLSGTVAEPYPIAALAGIPLAFAWLIAERLGIMEGRQLIAMTFVELLLFTILGPRLWWRLCGPLLYLYFLVPFGAFLTGPLQDVTTFFVRYGLAILHIPAYIDGYVIEIPEGSFLIAEACAGLRFLIAAVAFGCLYALLMYRSPIRRAVFIGVSIIVPIIANGFRALGIVSLGHVLGSAEAAATDHVLYGWMFFSIVIVLLIVFGLPFREDQQPAASSPMAPRSSQGQLRPVIVGVAALIVLAAIGPAVAAQFDRVTVPDMATELPAFSPAGNCSSPPGPLTAGLDAPGRMIVQRFECGSGPITMRVEIFSPRSTAARLVVEQRRLTGQQGAEESESRQLDMPDGAPRIWRVVETTAPSQIGATTLWVNGKPALGGLAMRMHQAYSSIMGARLFPVLVVVTADQDWSKLGEPGRRQAEASVVSFVQTQPGLNEFIARLSGNASGH